MIIIKFEGLMRNVVTSQLLLELSRPKLQMVLVPIATIQVKILKLTQFLRLPLDADEGVMREPELPDLFVDRPA